MNPQSNLCERFDAEGVWLWLDDDLSRLERKRWEAHLASCETCRRVLSETKSTLDRYDSIEEDTPGVKSIEAIFRKARQDRQYNFWRPILVAAAAIILVVQSAQPGWTDRIEELSERPLTTNVALEKALKLRAKQAGEGVSPIVPISIRPDRLKAYLEAPRFLMP
jgi:predicted anti-sigma-YlaC factor YlaD